MKEKDYQQTLTIIKFIDGTSKKFYDDKYQVKKEDDLGVVRVYNNATGKMILEGLLNNVCYIQYNVPKKQPYSARANTTDQKYGSTVTVGDEVDLDDIQAEFANSVDE